MKTTTNVLKRAKNVVEPSILTFIFFWYEFSWTSPVHQTLHNEQSLIKRMRLCFFITFAHGIPASGYFSWKCTITFAMSRGAYGEPVGKLY